MDSPAAAPASLPDNGVTVVIPAYNYAGYLERAVRSALAQQHPPAEILIVDDGSADQTPDLGRRLAQESPSVRYIRQENAGLSAARNTGVNSATQRFVAFLDADDEWLPGMLSAALGAFATLPATTGIVACDSYRTDAGGQAIGEKRTAPRGDRFFSASQILTKTRFMPSCVVARRECFKRSGVFDTGLRSSEDRDMWVRIAANWRVFYLDQPLVRIRKHGANMSKHADRMYDAMRRVRRKALLSGLVPEGPPGYWSRLRALEHFQAGWMYWDEGRTGRALCHELAALAIWPLPLDHRDLHEPPFFRLRAALRFMAGLLIRRRL